MLKLTKDSMNMITALENCIQFINDNSGLTVVGWYNIGVINGKSLIAYQKINNYKSGNSAMSYNTNKRYMRLFND